MPLGAKTLHIATWSTYCQLLTTNNSNATQPHTYTQPFYSSLNFVRDNPGELVPEGTFCRLLDFLVQNEDNKGRHTQQSGWTATPSRLIGAPISAIPTIFTLDALPGTTLPIYPGLQWKWLANMWLLATATETSPRLASVLLKISISRKEWSFFTIHNSHAQQDSSTATKQVQCIVWLTCGATCHMIKTFIKTNMFQWAAHNPKPHLLLKNMTLYRT